MVAGTTANQEQQRAKTRTGGNLVWYYYCSAFPCSEGAFWECSGSWGLEAFILRQG